MKHLITAACLAFCLFNAAGAQALTLQQIGDAGTDPTWVSRIKARLLQDAIAITTETILTLDHANRLTLAGNILRDPDKWTNRFTVVVAGQSGPASAASLSAVTDAQINTAVDSVINSFADNVQ